MAHPKTKPQTPWLAVLSVYELRRLFQQVNATGKLPQRAVTSSVAPADSRRAA